MSAFKEFLKEATKDKVIFVKDELWVTYGQGSGMTAQFPDIKKYITDSKGDKNFDSLVPKLVKFAAVNKPMKAKGNSKLFEIPKYDLTPTGERYDIWDGKIKPIGKLYMIIDTNSKMTVVNLFDNKKEAINWINSLVEGFKRDQTLLTRLRKEFWQPFSKANKDITFIVKNIKDGVEIVSNNIEAFNDALFTFVEDNDIEVSITSPKNNKITIKTYDTVTESSDTERVMLDIENVSALQKIAQSLSQEDFEKGIRKQSHLFKRKIKFKNVDWDTVYSKLNITK